LVDLNIPFYSDKLKENADFQTIWNPILASLDSAAGLVFVTPEWNGMVTPMLKNFLLISSTYSSLLAHKPVLIVTVSASRGGAYPVSELRSSGYKNNHIVYVPDHLIVRDANTVCNSHEPDTENKSDVYTHEKIEYSLKMLHEYTKAIKQVRDSGIIDLVKNGNGM
jgi:azobenzene reductase